MKINYKKKLSFNMIKKYLVLIIGIGSFFLINNALAYTLTSTTSSDPANGFGYSSAIAEKAAESFTTIGAGTMDIVTFSQNKIGAPTDNYTIEIQTDSSGSPSGTVLASFTGAGADLTTTPTDYNRSFGTVSLSASTKYWFVFKRSGTLSTTDYYGNPGLGTGSNYKWLNSSAWVSQAGTQRYSFDITELSISERRRFVRH